MEVDDKFLWGLDALCWSWTKVHLPQVITCLAVSSPRPALCTPSQPYFSTPYWCSVELSLRPDAQPSVISLDLLLGYPTENHCPEFPLNSMTTWWLFLLNPTPTSVSVTSNRLFFLKADGSFTFHSPPLLFALTIQIEAPALSYYFRSKQQRTQLSGLRKEELLSHVIGNLW